MSKKSDGPHLPLWRWIPAALCAALLLGCASPRELLGWPADIPFTLTDAELKEINTAAPVFSQGLAQIEFDAGQQCAGCGDFSDTNGIGVSHIEGRLNSDFRALLKQQLAQSPLFPRDARRTLTLRATLVKLDQHSSVGAEAERKSVITSGAVLTTRVSIRYDLLDGDRLADRWEVTTTARSNSLAASTRLSENIDGALKRNLRALLLRIVVDHSPIDAPRATRALAALQSEVDNKRIALAYLVYGATSAVTTTTGLIGDGLVAVAQHPEAVAAGLRSSADGARRIEAASRGSSVEEDQARARRNADFQARIAAQEGDPDSDLNRDRRARERQQAQERQAEAERAARRDATRRTQQANAAQGAASDRAHEAAEAAAQQKRDAEAAAAERERQRQRAAQEQQRQEELARLERKRQAEEAAARAKAEKEAEARAEELRKSDYLDAFRRNTTLAARHCPDGAGKHYLVGMRPRLKPEVVGCVDLAYNASCEGSQQVSSGVVKNFLGASTDCFMGDTATVTPTPACKPDRVRVVLTRAMACQ